MRVLAMDDESFALKDLVEAIEEANPAADVYAYQSPAKALAFAEENELDVAFLDIEMGSVNGVDFARSLKQLQRNINIVFVTGYSEYAVSAFAIYASGYLLKPVTATAVHEALSNLRTPVYPPREKGLWVQTFGNFEVFLNGRPLRFPRTKAKELLAYLIHKRGTGCSNREIASILYEDRPYSTSLQKQVQTILTALQKTLAGAGQPDVIVRAYNSTAVDVNNLNCDYYRFLEWDPEAINSYMGEYMTNYSWAEYTIGYLDRRLRSR